MNSSFALSQVVNISGSGTPKTSQEAEALRRVYEIERTNAEFRRLAAASPANSGYFITYGTVDLYPKQFADIAKKQITLSESVKSQYTDFLKSPNTGIVKILAEKACVADNSKKVKSITAIIEKCPFNFINGNGKFFSFRRNDYSSSKLADIGIHEGMLFSLGILNQGILANIGDVPLDQISLSTKGVEYLSKFVPHPKIEDSDKQYAEFEKGVVADNITYQKVLPAEVGKTYVLRVAAYEVEKYAEIKNDLRKDVIIAFKLVEKDEEGNMTLVWRELQRINSPKLIVPSDQDKK